jgi:hypothetical protein
MDIRELRNALELLKGPRFVGCTYTAKKTGELARYTMLLAADYKRLCANDIADLQQRVRNARGIEKVVLAGIIDSLEESIAAIDEGREHANYTKKGLYVHICQGLKIHINDGTCEIQGIVHQRKVIIPGEYHEVKHKTPETALRAEIRKDLRIGQFRTLAVDAGHIHSVRVNGDVLEFEQ